MKKKLLITVGAGASIDFGLPSVSDVDELFNKHAAQSHPLVSDPTSNLYKHCRDAIQTYYNQSTKGSFRKRVNFEEVLYQLNLLMPYLSDPDWQHGSNALLKAQTFPDVLEFGRARKRVDGNVLRGLGASLMDALVDNFISGCKQVSKTKQQKILELRQFLSTLQDHFDIGIISLNYDNVMMQAIPELHTGFDAATGGFNPQSVLDRKNWSFIYHLHGSVHFGMTGANRDMHAITWVDYPECGHTVHALGRNNQDSMEGTSFPTSTLVAGYGKTQQLLRQPYRTYFAQLNRLVHEADSLLFLGYGFGDLHLNAVFSDVHDLPRPTVVVDWADDDQDSLPFRRDNWSYQLFGTLPANASRMSKAGHKAPASVAELRAHNEMEVSNDPRYPLAVSYNGLLAAIKNPQKILDNLV